MFLKLQVAVLLVSVLSWHLSAAASQCQKRTIVARANDAVKSKAVWGKCSASCGTGYMTLAGSSTKVKCNTFPCHCHICCEIDLVFVVDRSASMWAEWEMLKQFMREMVSCMDFGNPNGVRVGIVMYNTAGTIHKYLYQGTSLSAVNAAISTMPTPSGGTDLRKGLDKLLNVFTSSKGERCKVCNVAVVLTDYDQSQGNVDPRLNYLKAPPTYNVKFFSVAFGNIWGSSPLLQDVANDPDSYYHYRVTPASMSYTARRLAKNACQSCQQCNNRVPRVFVPNVIAKRPS